MLEASSGNTPQIDLLFTDGWLKPFNKKDRVIKDIIVQFRWYCPRRNLNCWLQLFIARKEPKSDRW